MAGLKHSHFDERLGVYGGSFNPPHVGHLILASEALVQFNLDRVLWVLTSFPPHKTNHEFPLLQDRLDMLNSAIQDNTRFELSMIDVDRPPPHYAVDTLHILRQQYPNAQLVYLMGSDSLRDLPDWHTPEEFVMACDEMGVMSRPGVQFDLPALDRQFPGLAARTLFMDTPLLEISSSELRRKITNNLAYRYYLLPAVLSIIEARGLYVKPDETDGILRNQQAFTPQGSSDRE